jgi:hypothetical protein
LFREHAPAWAPPLPLNFADIERARRDESGRVNLVGHYAGSLLLLKYDYQTHPLFKDYACGLMAYPHAPDYLREDPELLSEFPPKLLVGIDAGLNWQTPEMIAESKQASTRCVQFWRDRDVSKKWLRIAVDEHNDYFSTISGLEFSDPMRV